MQLFDDVAITTLDNGITVISDYEPAAFGLAANIRICTGSHHDRADKMGLAHLAEHMMANGMPGMDMPTFRQNMAEFGMTLKGNNFNFETGPDFTDYWATGSTEGVSYFLEHIAAAIRERAYTREQFLIEQSRVVNETKSYLMDPECITAHKLNQGLFHNGALARWVYGGLPNHVANLTLKDVQAYHARTHTPDNIILFTSGSWTHEQVREWANDNLGSLDRGKAFKKVKSPYNPQNIRKAAPWLSGATHFFIGANLGLSNSYNPADWDVLLLALNTQFKALADKMGIYGMGVAPAGSNPEIDQVIVSSTPLEPGQVRDVIQASTDLLLRARETITPDMFEDERRRFAAAQKLSLSFNRLDIRFRMPSLRVGYYYRDDPTILNATFDRLEAADYDKAMALLDRVRHSRIATGYIGDQRDDFPTGDDVSQMMGINVYRRPAAARASAKPPVPKM